MANAVVFDFDGTITDTESLEFSTWSAEFASHGVRLELSEWIQCVGGGEWDVLEHLESLAGPLDSIAVMASRGARYAAEAEGLAPRPGVRELLALLGERGTPMAVASSSRVSWVCGYLEQFGLCGAFQAVVTRDHVRRVKPAPDLFLLAAQHLGIATEECVAIEDSPNGVAAAKAAGMRVVAFPNPVTESFDLSAADLVISSLGDPRLVELLALA
ncbi:MAG: HAD family hydrolase [Fimbriimonadaceae bacterium]